MKKILIANRGEIACRIIKSCKKLGLQSIAVYSDIDKNSKHVREADESIHIGGSKAQESYLLPKKIIEVAKKLKADAIHPGYGFMAENAEFAQNVMNSGIIIGNWFKKTKKRIASVKSTQKITKAMKMVAAAKLRRAQESAEKGRPYSEKMNNVILNLSNGDRKSVV